MTASISYSLTMEDLRAFRSRPRSGKHLAQFLRTWLAIVLFAGAAGLFAATLRLVLRQRRLDVDAVMQTSFLAGVCVMASVGLLLGVHRRRSHLRRADARLVARGPIDLRAEDERLEARQADTRSSWPWSMVAIEETPKHLFLVLENEEALVVPRSAIDGTELGALLAAKAIAAVAARTQTPAAN